MAQVRSMLNSRKAEYRKSLPQFGKTLRYIVVLPQIFVYSGSLFSFIRSGYRLDNSINFSIIKSVGVTYFVENTAQL